MSKRNFPKMVALFLSVYKTDPRARTFFINLLVLSSSSSFLPNQSLCGPMTHESATEWPDLHFKCNIDFCNFTNEPKPKPGHYQCKGCKIGNYTVLPSDAEKFNKINRNTPMPAPVLTPLKSKAHQQRQSVKPVQHQHHHPRQAANLSSSTARRNHDHERYVKEQAQARLVREETQRKRDKAARQAEAMMDRELQYAAAMHLRSGGGYAEPTVKVKSSKSKINQHCSKTKTYLPSFDYDRDARSDYLYYHPSSTGSVSTSSSGRSKTREPQMQYYAYQGSHDHQYYVSEYMQTAHVGRSRARGYAEY
ncbi:hypothetical protein D9758_015490 [Tetrapyrgos nigripes]|uniref:Uncharacterized protein n=1 Tax=Tetrapyrgos nigripes TaxID=182062 RepID=A0A8H5BXX9_9AGAR|nr:hypothetical protein D9758_015490 [Tetrapyrgos nigripes]